MKMRNKFPSRCTACGEGIPANSWIEYDRGQRMAYHEQCAPAIVVNDGKIDGRFNIAQQHHNYNNGLTTTKLSNDIAPVAHAVVPDAIEDTLRGISNTIEAMSNGVISTSRELTKTTAALQYMRNEVDRLIRRVEELENRPQKVAEITIKHGDTAKSISGTFHYKLPQLLRITTALDVGNRNVWLTGPAGSGKTTAAEQVAQVLNLPFEAHGAIDTPYKLSGYRDATGIFRDTSFYRIYKNGGVILLDECDGSSNQALLEINGALANSSAAFPEGMVERHPNCYILCAANTWGFGGDANYVGRSKMDAAFLDRFITIEWPYDEELERTIALDDNWTSTVQQVRRKAASMEAKMVISPRASIKGGQLLAGGCSRTEVVEAIFGRYRQHSAWATIGRVAEEWCRG